MVSVIKTVTSAAMKLVLLLPQKSLPTSLLEKNMRLPVPQVFNLGPWLQNCVVPFATVDE